MIVYAVTRVPLRIRVFYSSAIYVQKFSVLPPSFSLLLTPEFHRSPRRWGIMQTATNSIEVHRK